ncbi:exoribonuclease II [Gallibacterium salpingitidis]|uniref:Exoribonuclease 2 n=1 Tax=Gallibacterium salpingitidis TaxID=505341 RepID=A0A1A7P0B6_9PAST|nr:exoribonuclease II [Gallibacterium salpingitidis]OBW94684.1 exoribonuclease II [Gallibacterium salpingitidis]
MFQDNPLLSQLKQQIRDSKPHIEGVVKATDKAYGFLEGEKKSYFLPPQAMKKVMHGDKIKAVIETVGDKEQAEPDSLIEPMLTRFIARVRFNKDNKLQLLVDHPNIKQSISANVHKKVTETLANGDWVVAELKTHPLRDDRFFFAQVTQFICHQDDPKTAWWVTLARHQQPRTAVAGLTTYPFEETEIRQDLTALDFVTIDSETTEDMDDALFITPIVQDGTQTGWKLAVAVADPTAYIPLDSQIETDAKQRCFTNYLPGFNIPMLPRELSDDLCSLVEGEKRPALVCFIETDLQGAVIAEPTFTLAWICSKAKLAYDAVSDYLEQLPNAWQPSNDTVKDQIEALHQFSLARITWRQQHAILFKDRPDYNFILADDGAITEIRADYRRIANRIVEECMIIANTCAAQFLTAYQAAGIFNTHSGFDKKFLPAASQFLLNHLANEQNQAELAQRYSVETLTTLAGYCQMQHDLDQQPQEYLETRLRRYLTFAEFKAEAAPHFGLGLNAYATWTSPIRKYCDMVNHRVIKAILSQQPLPQVEESVLVRLQEARKQNRLVERDIADWLYCIYLADKVAEKTVYQAQIVDITRGGLRVQLIENGASVFVPMSLLHDKKEEIEINSDDIALYIQGKRHYQLADTLSIQLIEVNLETRSIVGSPASEQ